MQNDIPDYQIVSNIAYSGINGTTISRHSPLFEAVLRNNAPAVAALLQSGADPNIESPAFGPTLCYAAKWGLHTVLAVLL